MVAAHKVGTFVTDSAAGTGNGGGRRGTTTTASSPLVFVLRTKGCTHSNIPNGLCSQVYVTMSEQVLFEARNCSNLI